jgi:hypothetical protein
MKACLVTALTLSDFVDPQTTISAASIYTGPQLGVLCLASVLINQGVELQVIDLDHLFLDFLASKRQREQNDFFAYAADHITECSCDIFGFSTICSSFPLTLRLAREAKRARVQAHVILGGPQATVVDVPTLRSFPFVDYIVRGEADDTFPALLTALSSPTPAIRLRELQGITFRDGSDVIRTPNASVIEDLDRLPLPAYHLDPHIRNRGSVHMEIGRGCPYACTFCSTNDFFRRNFRLKSTPRMIEQMRHLKSTYGISNFSLVHDMYTIDRKKVVEFCETLLACGEEFHWGCSARTDRIDDELIALMAKAGCRGIFFGIETGSNRLQSVINKHLNLEDATNRIQTANRHGVKTAVALITGFPEETRVDLRDTVHYYVNSCRFDNAEPQISLLAPLAGTPIESQHRSSLIFDEIFSDMSHQGWQQDSEDNELIRKHPDIFPNFYAVPTHHLDRSYFKAVHDFVTLVTTWFRWLPVGLLQDSGDFLAVFDAWESWRRHHPVSGVAEPGKAPYYCRIDFVVDFLEFVNTVYVAELAKVPQAILTLVQCEALYRYNRSEPEVLCDGYPEVVSLTYDSFPYLPSTVCVVHCQRDYRKLIECLRNGSDLDSVPSADVMLVVKQIAKDEIETWQLSTPSQRLLTLCDGNSSVKDIIEQFAAQRFELPGVSAGQAAIFGLRQLLQQGFIGVARQPEAARQITGELKAAAAG